MIISNNIKKALASELRNAKAIWFATAMISSYGWNFLQKNISKETTQHYLIGVDLSTSPYVFEELLKLPEVHSRVYETQFTYHPKVYIIEKEDNELTAFIGSSNTTSWGLEKNVEMNFQITDQTECKKLIDWFLKLYSSGYLITAEFVRDYKIGFTKSNARVSKNINDSKGIKKNISKDKGQFFSSNQHVIFAEKYHRIDSAELLDIRRSVKNRFIELHESVYPEFSKHGILDLHSHHQKRERVSRHYFNRFSGNYVNAIWLHYGKSKSHLQSYANKKDKSFINHVRIQVIIHENSIGLWVILGKDWGSKIDRDYFRKEMINPAIQQKFFKSLKKLDDTYWIDYEGYNKRVWVKDVHSAKQLHEITKKENFENYFIIGCEIDKLDSRLSSTNISDTVLNEIKTLYPIYEIMRHK